MPSADAQVAPSLLDHLPDDPSPDNLLLAFLEWTDGRGLELYPHQEEAIVSMLSGDNVVLATPTGSGKSLVALAGAFAMVAQSKRAVYTAPIKALVSEKFFEMVDALGADNVGMVTGDAAVNAAAPVVVCTAEILANRALREGANTDVDLVVMDEFHYYGDRDRGWAWQVPLLELSKPNFLLMSATLGDTARLRADLSDRTGRETLLVANAERPVPLDFAYRETTLLETIGDLLEEGKQPIYIVHFTQKEAIARAQSLTSLDVLDKDEKEAVKAAIGGFRFDTPVGKDLKRFVLAGIGVHHAGLLPKYRLLVEKLAQQSLLKLICGTDTLGVGVNVPIRTVLFTQLCKYDGRRVRVLNAREFQQIAGRAGRRGFDTAGSVVVQAPEHVVENKKAEAKAATDPKKKKKLVKRKPPERGFAHWDGETLVRLSAGQPETLSSSFTVTHAMMLNVLDRPGDGCAAMRRLLVDNHETRKNQRAHIRRSIAVYRSLIDAEVLEALDDPDDQGRPVRINLDLQDDFRLNQPLSLFALEAIAALDRDAPDLAWQLLSVIESVLEDPMVDPARTTRQGEGHPDRRTEARRRRVRATNGATGASHVAEARSRLPRGCLRRVSTPSPMGRTGSGQPEVSGSRHARACGDLQPVHRPIRPQTFRGSVCLRYLTDCYKAMIQTVPVDIESEEFDDLTEWLGEMIRRVDSSLIDEWNDSATPKRAMTRSFHLRLPTSLRTRARSPSSFATRCSAS